MGALLHPILCVEFQVVAVARVAFTQLQLVCQLQPFLKKSYLAAVTHGLVTSQLVYSKALDSLRLSMKEIWNLPLVQNAVARAIVGQY